jgi:1-deoxy-D-xylulose-5-phosphate synthase
MAAGMAKAGLKPVVSIYSTFLQRAMDQVIHDVAILNLPVLFGIDRAGLVEDGETHQGVFDIAFLRAVPNFTVIAPKDTRELRNMVYSAIHRAKGPVAIRFPRDKAIAAEVLNSPELSKFELIDYTKWEILDDQGGTTSNGKVATLLKERANDHAPNHKAVALLAYGAMVDVAMKAKALLSAQGIEATVAYARSVKPLDSALLNQIFSSTFKYVVTLEEGCSSGGFGAAILEWASQRRIQARDGKQPEVACLAVPDHFIEHGGRNTLLSDVGLTPEKVAQFVSKVVRID